MPCWVTCQYDISMEVELVIQQKMAGPTIDIHISLQWHSAQTIQSCLHMCVCTVLYAVDNSSANSLRDATTKNSNRKYDAYPLFCSSSECVLPFQPCWLLSVILLKLLKSINKLRWLFPLWKELLSGTVAKKLSIALSQLEHKVAAER